MAIDDKKPVETAIELKLGTQFTSNVTTSGSGKSATNYVWSITSNPGVAVEPQLLIFQYEINMYHFTREFLQGTCEERLRNAVVESRVLHARNLCNLFCGFGEQGDIWLSDILDPVKPPFPTLIKALKTVYDARGRKINPRQSFNKLVAHMTRDREKSAHTYSYNAEFNAIDESLDRLIDESTRFLSLRR
jgi:hypothetical protein